MLHLLCEGERQQREQHGERAGADACEEIELEKIARAPDPFQLGAEHPQRQHVEQDVKDSRVQEHVGDELPRPELMHHERRHQAQIVAQGRQQRRDHEHRHVRADERLERR